VRILLDRSRGVSAEGLRKRPASPVARAAVRGVVGPVMVRGCNRVVCGDGRRTERAGPVKRFEAGEVAEMVVESTRPWRREMAQGGVGPGTTVRFQRTFTARDVEIFGHITRDYNPVHHERRFIEKKGFRQPICHGLLVGSMVCEPGGQWAWLASGMSFRFLKPVYVGDTITCEMTITKVDEKGKAFARAKFSNQAGELVMEAELSGLLPSEEERALLRVMISEGDPTNPLGGGGV